MTCREPVRDRQPNTTPTLRPPPDLLCGRHEGIGDAHDTTAQLYVGFLVRSNYIE